MGKEDERVSAGDALDRLEDTMGGRALAKSTFAEMLRDGKLLARADRVFVCGIRDLDEAWVLGLDEGLHVKFNLDLDFEHWRDSIQWIDDTNLWRWPESQFLVTTRQRPLVRNFFDGVTFSLQEIEELEAEAGEPERSKDHGGRRPNLPKWETFWMEVVQIARDGNLVSGQISSQAALRDELLTAMAGRGLSEDSIKEPVRRIWKRFLSE